MKKLLPLLLPMIILALSASAQMRPLGGKFTINAEGAIPVGDASDAYNSGFGLSGKFQAPVGTNVHFVANVGFTTFFIKDDVKKVLAAFGDNSSSRTFVPVEAGLKYFFTPMFYGEGEIGAAISTHSGSGTAFAYRPGLGFLFPAGGKDAFDVGFRYEGWSKDGTLSFIGLHVGYQFDL